MEDVANAAPPRAAASQSAASQGTAPPPVAPQTDSTAQRGARTFVIALNVVAPLAAIWLGLAGHFLPAGALIALAHVLWMVPTLRPQSDWYGHVVTDLQQARVALDTNASPVEDAVWLTIDDGPHPEDTPAMLDLLDRYGATATFFFIGERAAAHPELVREVVRRGHSVGNHTMRHAQYAFWAYGPRGVGREVREAQQVLTELAGTAPVWFRAPVGFKNPFLSREIDRAGLHLACWNARGYDGIAANKDTVMKHLKAQTRPGAIILMHEARAADDGTRLGPQVLAELLLWLSEQGLRTVQPSA